MTRTDAPKRIATSWRVFPSREGASIRRSLGSASSPTCPRCGEVLEAQINSRLSAYLVLDETAYDLLCRTCRRFCAVVQPTPRSIRLRRMRHFVAAVRAADPWAGQRSRRAAESPATKGRTPAKHSRP